MQKFPVSSSVLSADHLGVLVQDVYNLNTGVTCQLLKTGINHSYLIKDFPDKYVFRIYSLDWRTRLEIEEEIRLLNLLCDAGISVSYPIADADGDHIQELNAPEGMRYGVLFSFAEGEKLLNFPAEVHHKAGETMARIHQVTKNVGLQRATYTPQVLTEDTISGLQKFLPADSEEMAWILSTQKYLLNELAKADLGQLRTGAVHMDIWFDNFNITKDGQINLFDFDFCGNGWLCLDIAYYVLQLHSTEKIEDERNEKLNAFFAGYESITPISAEEKRLLPVLGVSMYFFYLGVQCRRFENWSNVFLNETYLKRFINLLVKKYFDENVVTATNVNPS
ncbi:phosphotransferase enzyme family protein [Mucilaginibacter phyllosphaerae]|uniref:Aminoglycoside phosphotransferase n=1 Tax=Mucilaginibacter phyllosphaerae TaxID=1812349 RepID=A0A4Y8AGZ1_9SPHI|nr:phosphotransferase [Mucilaginibacter phyllosphaerae]MBB3968866.1 Ser/Thr protein kinase RdoA (MazF antagonist) [Mucilaginibacter phyllosphaerae]TEW67505.1 aminoglycoside phosphotransferase [Mucilaginibacter phyllosphaerae]GGH13440.1 homoserine kinase [Mucilaginibacter phyllosphaerae]